MVSCPVITLLTDFGLEDPYVGVLHGVLLQRLPTARVVDLTHGVPPGDVRVAGFYWARSVEWFPHGTVHVAVVDPGVGTARGVVAAEIGGHRFIAPDNGLIGEVWAGASLGERRAVLVDVGAPALGLSLRSRTFHGRDVFAPLGAWLASGASISELGAPLAEPQPAPPSGVTREEDPAGSIKFLAEIIRVDRFGNAITALSPQRWCPEVLEHPERFVVEVSGRRLPLVRTYADVTPGAACGLISSFDTLEIAARDARAVDVLPGLGVGSVVRLFLANS